MRTTIAQLKIGQKGIISDFNIDDIPLKLLEMGCLPGEKVTIELVAPLGDPIAINISGYLLSLRKQDARHIKVEIY